jgi:hypothetical protein
MRGTILVGLALALAACNDAGAAGDEAGGNEVAATPADASAAVVLRGDGVSLAEGGKIAFGTSADQTVDRLAAAFGAPPSNRERLPDCGPGPLEAVSWDNGFSAYMHDGRFTGWTALDQRTAEGIGFGSTRAELDAAYHPAIERTSLGAEWSADGISGVLESDAPDAAVSAIWAGETCVMR